MNIKILTAEESLEYWNKEKEERWKWSDAEIRRDAEFMMNMPDMGNTKFITTEHRDGFMEWLTSDEAKEQWKVLPMTQHLAKYYAENKTK